MPKMLMVGAGIFGASVLLVMILLFTSGGASKSRQFEVLGELMSGRHGALSRLLLIAALGGLVVGALTCFSAVGKGDAGKRQGCQNACIERGYKKGVLGLSASRNSSGKSYQVCHCRDGAEKDIELDVDTLPTPAAE
jgi:hypothetical protein